MKQIICFVGLMFPVLLTAQDYSWWNEKHHWDGISHWSEYLTYTPKFFGPNALPIPPLSEGILSNEFSVLNTFNVHYQSGEKTFNHLLEGYIPISTQQIALSLRWVPFEHYWMNAEIRDQRKSRDFDGSGNATGDWYIGTLIQLIQNKNSWPDILLGIHIKTASGSNREATRFTDSPGYYFDLSAGKDIVITPNKSKIRPFAVLGFYSWQTNEDRNPQNDAFLFGGGISYTSGNTIFRLQSGGYIGYKGKGDQPIMAKFNTEHLISKHISAVIGIQKGIHDIVHWTFQFGLIHKLNNITDDR